MLEPSSDQDVLVPDPSGRRRTAGSIVSSTNRCTLLPETQSITSATETKHGYITAKHIMIIKALDLLIICHHYLIQLVCLTI